MNNKKEFLTLQNFRNKSDQGKHIQTEIALKCVLECTGIWRAEHQTPEESQL